MDANILPLSAVILCDRHGADETVVEPWPVQSKGRRALNHLTTTLEPLVDDIVLVTCDPLSVFDRNGLIAAPQKPAPTLLEGLHTGLTLVRHSLALVAALDAPWVQGAVIELLRSAIQPRWEAILPQVADRTMPFPALYAKGCLHRIELHLQRGLTSMGDLLEKVRFRPVSAKKLRVADPRLRSFEPLDGR
jgi:molybdopterin-guanine dinucleotide biosynthesis protein A